MESLSASSLRKLLRATAQATEFGDLAEFRTGVIALAHELVPCESVSYNEIKPGSDAIVVADPDDWLTDESIQTFSRLADENPLIEYYVRTGDGRPVRFSDFVSRRHLHRLALYNELYAQIGVEHQIAVVLPAPPGEIIGVALNRHRRDFTGEEAAMLELLRGPLRACYLRLVEREQLIGMLNGARDDEITAQAAALGLSERQTEIIHGVVGGASNAEVGARLAISRRTVEKHLQNIYAQLDVTSRTQAVAKIRGRAGR
jgi:DNA-binding CsgD family transcriptional regulator